MKVVEGVRIKSTKFHVASFMNGLYIFFFYFDLFECLFPGFGVM